MNEVRPTVRGKKTKIKSRKISGFLRGLLIYAGILTVLLSLVLVLLWCFMASYERSLQERAIEPYVSESGYTLLYEASKGNETNEGKLSHLFSAKIEGKELSYNKKVGEYSAAAPVYSIYADGIPYFTLALEEGDSVGFGMKSWRVKSITADESYYYTEVHTLTVLAETGVTVTVNGRILGEKDIEDSNVKYSSLNPYETGLDSVELIRYKVADLYTIPQVAAVKDGDSLSAVTKKDFYYVFMNASLSSYTVMAPGNASVAVNGYLLTKDMIISSSKYSDILAIELEHPNIPYSVTYRIDGMVTEPNVVGDIDGLSLESKREGDIFMLQYPDVLRFSSKISVPTGVSLYLHDKLVDRSYLVSENEKNPRFDGLEKYFDTFPMCDVYEISGLYVSPEYTAKQGDTVLEIIERKDNGKDDEIYFGELSNKEHDSNVLLDFLKLYVKYTAYGSESTTANYRALLPYVVSGSPVAKMLSSSVESIKWNSPLKTIKYNDIGVRSFVDYGDNCFTCEIYCDVMLSRWDNQRHYVSSWDVTCVKTSSGWLIWEMTTK
ncbi:MAG: hypothetical protein IKT70_00980 [Clostridia bacterium]|nr:hypothetical protein [Clostridia bacterium]